MRRRDGHHESSASRPKRATFARMAESIELLGDRTGWQVDGEVATYCPAPGGWKARVRLAQTAKYYANWHIAIIDPNGCARFVTTASSLGEVARVAEGRVRGASRSA